MTSLIDRIDNLASVTKHVSGDYDATTGKIKYTVVPDNRSLRKSNTQKSYSYDMSTLLAGGGVYDSQLTATAWGATLAYYKIPAVKSSVDFIAENAAIVPIVERDAQGNEIARSDKNPDKSPLIQAILGAYQYHGVPMIQEWVSSRLLYGQTFIQLVPNQFRFVRGLRWLNPNAITIHAPRGDIEGYYYGAFNDDIPPHLKASEVLYSRGFNPGDDIYGYSPTLNVMSKVNITLDFDRFTIAYYRNGGQLGMMVNFKEKTSFEEAEKLAVFWKRTFRGVDNFFKTNISHIPLDVTQYDPIDISKPLDVSKDAERSIYKGYRVAPELLGDTENNPYQFSDETKNAAMQTIVKPNLDAIANALNNKVAPYFLSDGHTIAFDLSAWETVSAEVISMDVQAGIVDLNESATKRGYKPDTRLKDIYMINNRPMHISVIQKLAMETPPEYLPAPAYPATPPQTSEPESVVTEDTGVTGSEPIAPDTEKAAFLLQNDPLSDALKLWQKVAMKRYKSDKLSSALEFTSDAIPSALHAAIKGALSTVSTPDEIYTVFDDADRWLAHA